MKPGEWPKGRPHHEWRDWRGFNGQDFKSCAHCGVVLRRDNGNRDNPCRGEIHVRLRTKAEKQIIPSSKL